MATKEVKIIKPTVANANNNLIRMAAYCRVSTDSADQVNSFIQVASGNLQCFEPSGKC